MYFNSIYVSNSLFTIWAHIFSSVDGEISAQLLRDHSTVHLNDKTSQAAWLQINDEINKSMLSSEKVLDEAFELIGVAGIDDKKNHGRAMTLFRLPDR